MKFWKQDIKLTVSIHVELQIINGKWMFMSLIVISDNDKPFRISQFSVWRIFIINSVKVQQNLFSSGFQNFHEFYLWSLIFNMEKIQKKVYDCSWYEVWWPAEIVLRLLCYCFSLVCTSWSHLCWFLSRDLLVLPESLWPSQDLVNTSGAIVHHWAYWIRGGPRPIQLQPPISPW